MAANDQGQLAMDSEQPSHRRQPPARQAEKFRKISLHDNVLVSYYLQPSKNLVPWFLF